MILLRSNKLYITHNESALIIECSSHDMKAIIKKKLFELYEIIENKINHCIDIKIKSDTIQLNHINSSLNICISKIDFEIGFTIPNINNNKNTLLDIIQQL
jgi:predicted metal-dependent TIM-barrel fold hydrolase